MSYRTLIPIAALLAAACFPEKITTPPCSSTAFTSTVNGDTTTTSTGLKFLETTVGGGNLVGWCQSISIHYEAYLSDGTKFDDSRAREIPLRFTPGVGDLIDGLEQGVTTMRGGGKRRLVIPPALGFGPNDRKNEAGQVVVPGGSTVIYDIEVIQVGTTPPGTGS
jgi:peptidylprolyl isomerase